MASKDGQLPRFSQALLWHYQELAHLVEDYRKPLVCHVDSTAHNGGAGIAGLSNFSGGYDVAEVRFDSVFAGLSPMGGASYVLGRLPDNLGKYLALTGFPMHGV